MNSASFLIQNVRGTILIFFLILPLETAKRGIVYALMSNFV
jgi:hypothetical protein